MFYSNISNCLLLGSLLGVSLLTSSLDKSFSLSLDAVGELFNHICKTYITLLFKTIALNLSKSVSLALLAIAALLVALLVAFHWSLSLKSLTALVKLFVEAFLLMVILNLVRESLLIGMSCLATPVVGPSMRT